MAREPTTDVTVLKIAAAARWLFKYSHFTLKLLSALCEMSSFLKPSLRLLMVRLFQCVICPLSFDSRRTLRTKLWNPSFAVTTGFFISWDLKVLSVHWDFGVMSCHCISGRIHQLGSASCKSEPAECQEYFKTRLDEAFLLYRALPAMRQNKVSKKNVQCLAGSWSQTEDRFSLCHEQIFQRWPRQAGLNPWVGSLQETKLGRNAGFG